MAKMKTNPGFTFIEAMVVVFLIVVITVTFYSVFSYGTTSIIESKKKLAAAQVASEKMEVIRNLNYADIGTTTGIVHGVLSEREVISRNSGVYYVFTFVQYMDDSYDGTLAGDTTGMNDYKRVRIKATWEDDSSSDKGVILVSNFSPVGIESDAGGGLLSINVLDDNEDGIGGANVHIVNSDLGIDMNATTDDTGNILFPSAPEGDKNYSISVTKDDYYPVQTYPPYPGSTFNPVNEDISILEGQPTTLNLYTDESSNLTLQTQDPFGEPVESVSYNLAGGMKIGDTVEAVPVSVYAYDQNLNSGSSGENALEDMSSGTYTFSPNTISGYEFLRFDPINVAILEIDKFILLAGTDTTEKAIFLSKTLNSLLVTVENDTDQTPVKGASVQLKNELLPEPYDKTIITNDFGQAYFPDELPELVPGPYDLIVTAAGFDNETSSVNVSQLTKKTISLIAE